MTNGVYCLTMQSALETLNIISDWLKQWQGAVFMGNKNFICNLKKNNTHVKKVIS